jgi:hypothetical protein
MAWSTAHLPFIMSFVLAAGALSKLVLATDCRDTKIEDLTETYILKSDPEIPIGLRWFYCGGLGIALFCMGKSPPLLPVRLSLTKSGIISICHVHKDPAMGIRVRKSKRMANRFAVCIILCCLPTAHHLNSLQLISIVTGLIIWVLFVELFGCSSPEESFFGEKKQCKYTARCKISKKDLESAVKGGHVINVSELSDRGEKGLYEMS